MSGALHDMVRAVVLFLPKAVAFVAILVVGWLVARVLRTVVAPILIAVLAAIAGFLVVGVGGGLVRPMQARWESWLDRAAQESQAIAEHARAYQAGRADAEAAMEKPAVATTEPAEPEASATPTQVMYGARTPGGYPGSAEPTQVIPPVGDEPPRS